MAPWANLVYAHDAKDKWQRPGHKSADGKGRQPRAQPDGKSDFRAALLYHHPDRRNARHKQGNDYHGGDGLHRRHADIHQTKGSEVAPYYAQDKGCGDARVIG